MRRFLMLAAVSALAGTGLAAEPFGERYRALWSSDVEAGIAERIERCRKADCTADGFPHGAEVSVTQVSSDFLFGANMFVFDQLGSPEMNAAYRAAFTGLFNAATIPFYWENYEPERGLERFAPRTPADGAAFWNAFDFRNGDPYAHVEFRRPAPLPLIEFCRANGLSTHGHALIYMAFIPKWLDDPKWTADEMDGLMAAHIRSIAARAGSLVDQWDVVNEATGRTCTPSAPNDDVPWFVQRNRVKCAIPRDHAFKSFAVAAEAFPREVRLSLNDAWPTNQCYPAFAKSLVDRGARIDVVGLQRHIFDPKQLLGVAKGEIDVIPSGTAWAPETELHQLAELDRCGRPIHISEITLPSPRGLEGLSDDEADAIQARVVRDQYRLWFSWPSVCRITYWNLVDGTGAANERMSSGWFNRDMSPKRVQRVMDDLINREWRTRTVVKADAAGRVGFRGFKGRYRLEWTDADGKVRTRSVDVR